MAQLFPDGPLPGPERCERIHLGCATGRHDARNGGDCEDDNRHRQQGQRVVRADAVENVDSRRTPACATANPDNTPTLTSESA